MKIKIFTIIAVVIMICLFFAFKNNKSNNRNIITDEFSTNSIHTTNITNITEVETANSTQMDEINKIEQSISNKLELQNAFMNLMENESSIHKISSNDLEKILHYALLDAALEKRLYFSTIRSNQSIPENEIVARKILWYLIKNTSSIDRKSVV